MKLAGLARKDIIVKAVVGLLRLRLECVPGNSIVQKVQDHQSVALLDLFSHIAGKANVLSVHLDFTAMHSPIQLLWAG